MYIIAEEKIAINVGTYNNESEFGYVVAKRSQMHTHTCAMLFDHYVSRDISVEHGGVGMALI